ncbi:MAG TPA: response regulator transcription factor [Mariprofundaceae bacterium]|nr:response regulator transcription factor [Mariprofundaceae bacterium]
MLSDSSVPVHVLLVEDNQHTRTHLGKVIVKNNRFEVSAVASCHEAKKALLTTGFDFLVLDLGLPDGDGMDLIEPALQTNPNMLILVLTVFGEDESVVRAIQAGAKGYLLKDQALDNIQDTLVSMQEGGSPIDHRVARALLKLVAEQPHEKPDDFQLSDSEKTVLSYISQGRMYKEIAHEMDISINTVREFVRRIYKKLQVNSRSQAMHLMNKHNINLD